MEKSNISVIIRCKNEERWVGYCIQSILEKIYKPEIIVVNNNSTDNSMNIVKSFKESDYIHGENEKYTKIRIININDYTPGKALNKAVLESNNEYLLIISSHCTLKKIDLEKHTRDLNRKDMVAVFGNQIPIWNGKKITKRYMWANFINEERLNMYSEAEQRMFLHNALAMYRKDILLDYEFDEDLISKEDRYWAKEMIEDNKFNILYDPKLEAEHHYTTNGATWKGLG